MAPISDMVVIAAHAKPPNNCGQQSTSRPPMRTMPPRTAFLLSIAVSFSLMVHAHVSAAPDSLSWLPVGAGVNYAAADSALGEGVFIGFGGLTIQQEWANGWVANLYAAKLRTLGIRHLYSIEGPNHAEYINREIGTLDLARQLLLLMQSSPASNRIIVAAHSAGSYVAHALFKDLYDGASIDSSHSTDGRITYFNLDGFIGAWWQGVEITRAMADRLGHIYGVYAFLPSLNFYSPYRAGMVELGEKFGSRSSSMVIEVSGCGCISDMCLHMTLINQKPYNKLSYDSSDYARINADHPVATAYLDVITALNYGSLQPMEFWLWQNYPNPFNPSTTIRYGLPNRSRVTLAVFNTLGQQVALLQNGEQEAGYHEVKFDGAGLSSGVYFYRIEAGSFVETKKLLLMK
jgi:hypothetical protein